MSVSNRPVRDSSPLSERETSVAVIAGAAFAIFFYLHKALFGVLPYGSG